MFLVNYYYALICILLLITVPDLEYKLLQYVLFSRSWFLFSSTCCSYLFSSRSWFLFSCTCCSYLFSSRSWFLFSSTYCYYLFSFLDHGSCSQVHTTLICSLFQIMVPVLGYMLLLAVLNSRSWFLFSSTCCSYLFYILDHGSCS